MYWDQENRLHKGYIKIWYGCGWPFIRFQLAYVLHTWNHYRVVVTLERNTLQSGCCQWLVGAIKSHWKARSTDYIGLRLTVQKQENKNVTYKHSPIPSYITVGQDAWEPNLHSSMHGINNAVHEHQLLELLNTTALTIWPVCRSLQLSVYVV